MRSDERSCARILISSRLSCRRRPEEVWARPRGEPRSGSESRPPDADLRRLIDAWPTLPDAIRAGIEAIVQAAAPIDAIDSPSGG